MPSIQNISLVLDADIQGADSVTIDGQPAIMPAILTPTADHVYELIATGPDGTASAFIAVDLPAVVTTEHQERDIPCGDGYTGTRHQERTVTITDGVPDDPPWIETSNTCEAIATLYRFGTPTQVLSLPGSAGQGVSFDATRRWTCSTTSLNRYNTSWVQQLARVTSGDAPTNKTQLNGVAYDGSKLYIGANNYPNTPKLGWIVEYAGDALTPLAERAIGAHYVEGCAIRGGEFWVFYHDWPYVTRFDSSWAKIADYPLPGDVAALTDNLFQGGFWIGDDLYLPKHNNNILNTYYVYRWNGTAFTLVETMPAPKMAGYYAGQGIAIDQPGQRAWWAQRRAGSNLWVLETPLVAPAIPGAGWTELCTTMAGQPGAGMVCTMDTTGADLLYAAVNAASSFTVTLNDSRGNTWTPLPAVTVTSNRRLFPFYCKPTSVGSGHGITVAGATFSSMFFGAYSGSAAAPLDQHNKADGGTQAGAITPSEDDTLIIAAICSRMPGDYTIDSGFTVSRTEGFASGNFDGLGVAILKQGTAATVNPAWSQVGACAVTSFKAAA